MRLIIILIFDFQLLILSCFSQSGWYSQNSGTSNFLYSVYFPAPATGWAVGQNGTILKTTNAGNNWSTQISGISTFLYSNFFIDVNTGWAVGQSGVILKTTNAGTNWSPQVSGFPGNFLYSVIFTDVNTSYIVGSTGLILKTTNSGNNWTQQLSGVTGTLSVVHFPVSGASLVGYAAGGTATEGFVVKTADAGLNWTPQTVGMNWLFGIHFVDIVNGCAVGFNGVIYTTTNGGVNWVQQLSPTTNRLVAVHFPNSSTGWAVGYAGTILRTTNSGVNWTQQTSTTTQNLWSVFFTDSQSGWAAGWTGTIIHTTNGGVMTGIQPVGNKVPSQFRLYQNYPNPFNPSTIIRFDITPSPLYERGDGGLVSLKIFDALGREVSILANEDLKPGSYEVEWDASNYPSGIYYYKLTASEFSESRKMILLK